MNGLSPGFGKRIKDRRNELKMKQRELAEKSGIALRSIQDYESEKRTPKIDTRIAIARVLEVDYAALFLPDNELIDDFSPESAPARAYNATEILKELLWKMAKFESLEDKRFIRVYGNSNDDYIDMNAVELSKFLFYLVRLIESGCQNYIDVCRNHDETKDLIPKE